MTAPDLFVKTLQNEGVDRIYAVPGEENLDVVKSRRSLRDACGGCPHCRAATPGRTL